MGFFFSWQSHPILCIDDFSIHSSATCLLVTYRLSCCECCPCTLVCTAVVAQSLLLSCKTETVPKRHSVRIPLPHLLALTILLSVSMELTALVLVWADSDIICSSVSGLVTEHNALRVHPRWSLCQNCLPFRLDNTYCVDGSWPACPFFCRGTHGMSTFISQVL